MIKVLITYKLHSSVSREKYRQWSREVDQPIAGRQPGVLSYRIFELNGPPDEMPYDIVEDIEVESWEAWQAVGEQTEMQDVIEQFFELCDRTTLQIVHGSAI